MRLIVARCEVVYTGRLNARLPEALRLLVIKSDGSVMVHADHGGYKPSNWMTPPAVLDEEGEPLERIRRDPAMSDCRGVLAGHTIRPQARTLAETRGIDCVEVDLDVVRGDREPDLTLFAA